jgi:pyruvate,water dikinase
LIDALTEGKPELGIEDGKKKAKGAYVRVRKALTKQGRPGVLCASLDSIRMTLFDHVLSLTQRYMPLREDQRFYWQKGLSAVRELFLIVGDRLVADGVLKDREQVFFAIKDEIEAYVGGKNEFPVHSVQARQREFQQLQKEHRLTPWLTYPLFLVGNRPVEVPLGAKHFLTGQPVSPGLKIGPVRVLAHPNQFRKIRTGDIMVTRSTDPGWTPIFAKLGGLITETGGQLSHGAVVAREYGLPAVVGIPGITQRLQDGQMVLLDGSTGRVNVIS